MFFYLSSCILLIHSCPNRSSNPFVVWDVSCHPLSSDLQFVVTFFLENLRPLEQCFRTGIDRITWGVESSTGQKAFAGSFVIRAGSHAHLEMMSSA
jgi:hypothetical protein